MINREKNTEAGLSVLVGYALNIFVASIFIGIITLTTTTAVNDFERTSMDKSSYVTSSDLAHQVEKIDRLHYQKDLNISYQLSAPELSYEYSLMFRDSYVIVNHESGSVSMPLNVNSSVEQFTLRSGEQKIIEVNNNEIKTR